MSCRVSTEFTGPQISRNFSLGASAIRCVHPKATLGVNMVPTCARSTKENLVGAQGLSSGYNLFNPVLYTL
jgi:hypothetical protein